MRVIWLVATVLLGAGTAAAGLTAWASIIGGQPTPWWVIAAGAIGAAAITILVSLETSS